MAPTVLVREGVQGAAAGTDNTTTQNSFSLQTYPASVLHMFDL